MKATRIGMLACAAPLVAAGWPAGAFAADFGDGLVHLRGETYSVTAGPSDPGPAERETALAPDAPATWIVALTGPAGDDVRARIEEAGGRVVGAVPSNAYVVRAVRTAVGAIRGLSFVARVDVVRPSWKISPDIGRRTFRDPQRAALGRTRLLEVSFFPGEDPGAAAEAVTAAGARVVEAHGERLLVLAEPEVIPAIARVSAVEWIEEPGEIDFRNDNVRWVIQSNQSGVLPLYDHGLLGEGEIIGHIDGQLLMTSCFFEDKVDNTPGPNHRKVVANRSHGNLAGADHGIHTAGTAAGDREPTVGSIFTRGMAPHARLSFTNLWNVTGFLNSPSNLLQYLDLAHQDGARVHTNSWGEDPNGFVTYTSMSVDVDTFGRANEEDLVVFAVANQSLTNGRVMAPENSKNCLSVASAGAAPNQANHGNGVPGPTYDGRRKPEVNAPGVATISAAFAGCATVSRSGTSMAAPAVAGGATLVRQYFRRGFYPTGAPRARDALIPTGALLRATVINSAVDMTGVTGYPSDLEGWGRILLDDALYFQGDTRRLLVRDVRHAEGLSTGQTRSLSFRVVDTFEPLKITMVFADQPAAQLAAAAPVNDLDLEVEGPGGLYLGNVFDTAVGVSVPGGTADALNNVERVILAAPAPGNWIVRVRGTSVPLGPQGYAIAVNGGLFSAFAVTALPPEGPGDIRSEDVDLAPGEWALDPMFPSPFRVSTSVRLAVPERAEVSVTVYDIGGRRVRSLLDRSVRPGEYRLTWDGRDEAGQAVVAGIYFVRMQAAGVSRTVRGVLLR